MIAPVPSGRRLLLAALAGLAVLAGAGLPGGGPLAAADAEGVRLRYGLRPGSEYEGTMRATLATHMTMEGLPEEAAAMTRALLGDGSQTVELKMLLRAGQAAGELGLPVECTLSGGTAQMTLAGQSIEIPGAKEALASSPSWKGRVTPDRLAVEIDPGSVTATPGLPADTAGRVMQALPRLPDRPLRPGDSFEAPSLIAIPGLPMAGRVRVRSKIVFTLKSASAEEALFDTESFISTEDGGGETARGKVTLSGRGTGHASFDLREGHFTTIASDLRIDAEIEVPFPAAPDPPPEGAGEAPKIVTIRATMQGPTEYALRLRPAHPSTGS